jgi:hypothetical protein
MLHPMTRFDWSGFREADPGDNDEARSKVLPVMPLKKRQLAL